MGIYVSDADLHGIAAVSRQCCKAAKNYPVSLNENLGHMKRPGLRFPSVELNFVLYLRLTGSLRLCFSSGISRFSLVGNPSSGFK
jgi:hypothetical protein